MKVKTEPQHQWIYIRVEVKLWPPPPPIVVLPPVDERPCAIALRPVPLLIQWFKDKEEGLARMPRGWNQRSVKIAEGFCSQDFYNDFVEFLE